MIPRVFLARCYSSFPDAVGSDYTGYALGLGWSVEVQVARRERAA